MTAQALVPAGRVTVTSEVLAGDHVVIAHVATLEIVAGPFLTPVAARVAWNRLPAPADYMIVTASWLDHLAVTPSHCGRRYLASLPPAGHCLPSPPVTASQ